MTVSLALGALVGGMSSADVISLVISLLVIAYLLYALLRGERF